VGNDGKLVGNRWEFPIELFSPRRSQLSIDEVFRIFAVRVQKIQPFHVVIKQGWKQGPSVLVGLEPTPLKEESLVILTPKDLFSLDTPLP